MNGVVYKVIVILSFATFKAKQGICLTQDSYVLSTTQHRESKPLHEFGSSAVARACNKVFRSTSVFELGSHFTHTQCFIKINSP